jgi:hypothetical protein
MTGGIYMAKKRIIPNEVVSDIIINDNVADEVTDAEIDIHPVDVAKIIKSEEIILKVYEPITKQLDEAIYAKVISISGGTFSVNGIKIHQGEEHLIYDNEITIVAPSMPKLRIEYYK